MVQARPKQRSLRTGDFDEWLAGIVKNDRTPNQRDPLFVTGRTRGQQQQNSVNNCWPIRYVYK